LQATPNGYHCIAKLRTLLGRELVKVSDNAAEMLPLLQSWNGLADVLAASEDPQAVVDAIVFVTSAHTAAYTLNEEGAFQFPSCAFRHFFLFS
jgi:hypothetical protein